MTRTCLAISSFKNDAEVLELLASVLDREDSCFDEICVVDSLGTGKLPDALAARGWSDEVVYECHATNLGSAGNLARRLELAAERGHDWVYAINHDGSVDMELVRALVACGASIERAGAVYPLRYKVGRGMYDLTGVHALPLPFRGSRERPNAHVLDVHWGSSNGTLYACEPIRRGLLPWADLWMGWEDLGYGWLLRRHGYRQVVLADGPRFEDPYEFKTHRALGRSVVTVTDKPAWYAYYQARNLVLVTRRNRMPPLHWAVVGARLVAEVGITTLLRRDKAKRYRLLARGAWDGLTNRSGKWRLP